MECVEARAMRISFRPEGVVKSAQQVSFDDELYNLYDNGPCGAPADEFFVDSLLDFSNGDTDVGLVVEELEEEKDHSVSSYEQGENDNSSFISNPNSNSSSSCVIDDFGSIPGSEIAVPTEDMADLEWLSTFVEDSFSEFSLLHPVGNQTTKVKTESVNWSQSGITTALPKRSSFVTPFPTKKRSKRSRTGDRIWLVASPSLTESSSTGSSSLSSSASSSFPVVPNPGQNPKAFIGAGKSPLLKKKKQATEAGGTQPQRRCSHCHVQKTPQWRTGPLGAKTLCNACGVRYKSGRLLPEYRPACSPTFSCGVHSNSHRKVLEMRRKRELPGPEPGVAPPVAALNF